MIKKISTTALALVALGGAAPMFASAASAEPIGNTDVRYINDTIIDPGADADYVISIPSSIQFSNNKMEVSEDLKVKILDKRDTSKAYPGERTASVTANSKNGWFVEKSGEKLKYDLTYDGKLLDNGTNNKVGKDDFSKTYTQTGTDSAKLQQKGTKKGIYSDVITFTVVDKAPAVK